MMMHFSHYTRNIYRNILNGTIGYLKNSEQGLKRGDI
jgi:hypothetical protein